MTMPEKQRNERQEPDVGTGTASIEEIIADVRAGKPVIIVDDEDRENEGDLIVAAEKAGADVVNFMAREARGLICLPMERAMTERLGLELMGRGDNARHKTAFTVSIEAKEGVTTGISAADRARTIQTAINPESGPSDIATPGHVFPLRARDGGVLVRAGHTEAAVDLARLAGFSGAGVICEIMNDDGTMARFPDLIEYGRKHGLKIGTIADLISYRLTSDRLVRKIHESRFNSRYGGEFTMFLYADTLHGAEHVVLVKGEVEDDARREDKADSREPVPVRMHAVDVFEDILGGNDSSTLHKSMEIIGKEGRGIVVIIRAPKPGALSTRLAKTGHDGSSGGRSRMEGVYNSGSAGQKSRQKSLRNYGIGAQILIDLGVRNMELLTNSPKNVVGLEGYGLYISAYRPVE